MRVVLGVHHYPPTFSAGVEVVVQRHARRLLARGHAVEVVCVDRIDAREPLSVSTEKRDGVLVHRLALDLSERPEPLGFHHSNDGVARWFSAYFAAVSPELFHSHSSYLLSTGPLEAAMAAGIPTVVTLHDHWYYCPRINLLRPDGTVCDGRVEPADCARCLLTDRRRYRVVDRLAGSIGRHRNAGANTPKLPRWPVSARRVDQMMARKAHTSRVLNAVDQVVILGPFSAEMLAAHGLSPRRLRSVPSGHDMSQWLGLAHTPRSATLRIRYLGQLAPHKGVSLLIDAVKRLRGQGADVELEVHGDPRPFPTYTSSLKKAAAGEPRIRFSGPYENVRVERILSESDVVVIPSLFYETRPLVMLESFAAKVPVVASRLPNLEYQVHDEVDGLLFEAGNAADLARQLGRLVDQPELLDTLRRGIAPVRTVDDEVTEIEDVYASLVGAASRVRSAPATATVR